VDPDFGPEDDVLWGIFLSMCFVLWLLSLLFNKG
jgi:hypothetical protein